ncbi:response regulator transcription factor [Candidatus Woesebacteria bacterium]|nr:response regulator transcription factor [Candidatus Woesebacteria bacterium]
MKHILIVENDIKLAKTLTLHLQSKQFFCITCDSVKTAITELENFSYDLVLLDRILNDGDGIEVAQFLSDFSYQTKILVLSELSQPNDRITGLEKGADDYLPKPFSLTELTIKINKLLSTQKIKSQEQLTLGKLLIHPESGELIINGKTHQVRKKEIQLLTCLIRHKNQVVSRNKIIDIVWSGNYNVPTQSTLDVYVRRLRITLGKYKNSIKTVRGFGYMALE